MITFHYSITDLLENSQIQSMYKAVTQLEASVNVVDDTVISDEDLGVCKKFLKTASANIAQVLSGYMKHLFDGEGEPLLGYEFDVPYTEQGAETQENQIIFRLGVPDNFNFALTESLDTAIQDALENFVLLKTAKLRGIDFVSYLETYDEQISNIRYYIHQRTEFENGAIPFY